MRVFLTLIDGEKIDVQIPSDSVTIGRSNKCDIVIPKESMSRQHCRVEIKGGEFFITDLNSINGVFIDGNKTQPNTPTSFQTFLNISFGSVVSGQFSDDATNLNSELGFSSSAQAGSTASAHEPKQRNRNNTSSHTQPDHKKITKKSNSKKQNPLLAYALSFVGILFALYYFLYADKEPISTNLDQPDTSQPAPKVIESNDHF
jgi:pSer/pThr/pTyr-binding forkhead associated (FHA) protein